MTRKRRPATDYTPRTAGPDAAAEDILINCKAGIITTGDIQRSINNYLESLHDPSDIYNNKPMIFNGLLEYIYRHNIKYLIPDNLYSYDWDLLNDIFINIYINLCYTFNYIPMVSTYILHLVHANISYIYTIKDGIRCDNSKVNTKITNYLKIWSEYSDSDLFNHIAQNNSVGGMFVAKVRGYTDQPQITPAVQITLAPTIDTKQLEAAAAPPEIGQN